MAERVLTQDELNRATLARQLLLRRHSMSAMDAIDRLAGLQAQWPPSPYIGLWSRLDGFHTTRLERALLTGAVLKATLMRSTLHLITATDYPFYWAALHAIPSWVDEKGLADALRVVDSVRALGENGPVAFARALEHLETEHGIVDQHARRVWHAARVRAHVLYAPETALFTTRPKALFTAVDVPEPFDPLEATAMVVHRYLAAFGPASRADIAEWSGLRVSDLRPALEELELRRFRDERGRELLDLEGAPLPDPETPAPVRLLPRWDNLLLAFADRTRVLPDEYRRMVIRKNGDVLQTFLVNGRVAGTWAADRKGNVTLEPFARLRKAVRAEADAETAALSQFLP
jgi:Winged helix DNA-binding domain